MFSATLTELVNGQSDMFVRQHRYFTENLSKNLPNKSSAYPQPNPAVDSVSGSIMGQFQETETDP